MDGNTSEKLFRTYYMKVYSFVMNLAKNSSAAEEITQETFYRATVTDKTFRGESDEFTWLCAIAKNIFFDELRKNEKTAGEIPEDFTDRGNNPEEIYESEDTNIKIHMVIHNLEEPYKEVFSLRVFGDLSFAEIGTVFGKTENWARVTYHRARLKIQERMDAK